MTFPLEQSQLLLHLRTTYLCLGEDSEYFGRIISNETCNTQEQFGESQFSHSPPITFETDLQHQSHGAVFGASTAYENRISRKTKAKRGTKRESSRSRRFSEKDVELINPSIDERDEHHNSNEMQNLNDSDPSHEMIGTHEFYLDQNEIRDSSTPREASVEVPQEKGGWVARNINFGLRNHAKSPPTDNQNRSKIANFRPKTNFPISKLFHPIRRATSDSDSSDDDPTKRRTALPSNGPKLPKRLENNREDRSSTIIEGNESSTDIATIDSDFGVPVDSKGQVLNNLYNLSFASNTKTHSNSKYKFKHNSKSKSKSNSNSKSKTKSTVNDTDNYNTTYDESFQSDEQETDTEEELEEEADDDDDEDEYQEGADDDDEEDEYSNDLEFTDLDQDSLLDSTLMSETFNSGAEEVTTSGNEPILNYGNQRGDQKPRSNTIGDNTVPRNYDTNFLESQTSSAELTSFRNRAFTNLSMTPAPTLTFTKRDPKQMTAAATTATTTTTTTAAAAASPTSVLSSLPSNKVSKLSLVFNSKLKSPNTNPLQFYGFVGRVDTATQSSATVNVFVPPRTAPVIRDLKLNSLASISDCIGFILYTLFAGLNIKDVKDFTNLDPNTWRLELVDEDGDTYGAFGILDRGRAFSSYNCPRDIALCKVENPAEVRKNERDTPILPEVKDAIEQAKNTEQTLQDGERPAVALRATLHLGMKHGAGLGLDLGLGQSSIPEEKFLIMVYEYDSSGIPEKVAFSAPRVYNMGQVLKEFCSSRGLITAKYRFKVQTQHVSQTRFVKDVEMCGDLPLRELVLVPSDFSLVTGNSLFNNSAGKATSNITPAELTLPRITPTNDQLGRKDEIEDNAMLTHDVSAISKRPVREGTNSSVIKGNSANTNKYLEELISGFNPQLPININSIYFKWTVTKTNSKMKKMKLKTYNQRMFIIDGDYIHLTPPDYLNSGTEPGGGLGQHHNFNHHNLNHQYIRSARKQLLKTYSFHITQVLRLKQYSKSPDHFRILVQKQQFDNGTAILSKEMMKKFYLIAQSESECCEIISKLKWVLQVYKLSTSEI
ncbi:hypothetical protein LELG_03614 [Lodderomyces elongisporus NRRL YB-4239]|uniref:Sin1 middle CRIM domain-containing protein n=1 Tax=Lodderomyces elongisporus (strain ATCC 11503 / CBS 2605 / JCM 1781 / NBRC 1676 / NRRL YB-4239) TaxID=379508 RepID=A5E1X7_LODEL|nr:hypothetical protein LELG_03614 [Lodderomyces elongisporus NRRL YB-4239]